MRAALKSGASLDSMPEVMSSGLIQRLRETQVQLKAQIADLSTSLLSGHPRIRALNSPLAGLDAQIRNEAQKVLAGLETEAKRARMREDQLVSDLNRLKAEWPAPASRRSNSGHSSGRRRPSASCWNPT